MTDEELAKYLGIQNWPDWQKAIDIIPPSKRASYERMSELEMEIALWQQGLGPKPRGVLIDMAKTPKRARATIKKIVLRHKRSRNHITT